MTRYSYQTRSDISTGWRGGTSVYFHVLDAQRRSDEPIATCKSRDDAEKIVEALNTAPVYGPSDLYWTTPRPWPVT